jgi:manganese/zinc/iron transport system ATP- binding protein
MRGKIAYIPQREAIDWTFPITVRELVFMGLYPKRGLFGFRTKEDDKHVDAALKQVGLEEYANREIGKLSGGQQQRAFLARALVQEADVYFLDEPLSGVDHASEQLIMRLLHAMQKSGKTIFMIHHDLNNVEKYFNWLILLNVRVIRSGVTKDVFTGDLLKEAYGKNFMLYDETVKRASEKILGKQ